MKQVIIRIKNEKGKVINKCYYTTQAQYNSYAFDDIVEVLKTTGVNKCEIDIKVGNQFRTFITVQDNIENCEDSVKEQLYDCVHIYCLKQYIKDYLPEY